MRLFVASPTSLLLQLETCQRTALTCSHNYQRRVFHVSDWMWISICCSDCLQVNVIASVCVFRWCSFKKACWKSKVNEGGEQWVHTAKSSDDVTKRDRKFWEKKNRCSRGLWLQGTLKGSFHSCRFARNYSQSNADSKESSLRSARRHRWGRRPAHRTFKAPSNCLHNLMLRWLLQPRSVCSAARVSYLRQQSTATEHSSSDSMQDIKV